MLAKILIAGAIPLALAHADFQYESTSKLTGGSLLTMLRFVPGTGAIKEPQVSTIAFKGNRMVRRSKRQAEIIDLDKRTITTVNFDKKTWSEMTFDQMKQMLDEASNAADQKQPDANGKQVDLDLNVDVKDTGKSKSVNGMDANEFLLTMTMTATDPQSGQSGAMNVTSDMWITKNISGADEMREFYKRMAKELDWAPTGFGNILNRPDVAKAMSKMMAEGSKMEGTPVEQIVRMGGAGAGGDSAGAATATQSAPKPSLSDAVGGALGGRLGLGGFGRKKKEADAQPATDASSSSQSAGVLMEMTVDNSGFSKGSVDEALFAFPSDFKKVDETAAQGTRSRKR
jgi:hypothetical protein